LTKVWLLDVNVLLAWLWPTHEAHKAASDWKAQHRQEPWSTCPITEMGFLRIVTNPSFSSDAPAWAEAVRTLAKHTSKSAVHRFWQDSLTSVELDRQFGSRIEGPGQITDAYLLALAMQNNGRLVTFDRRVQKLAPQGTPEHAALEILHF
jgi:toxin-antitoxin system PIN domain toxin